MISSKDRYVFKSLANPVLECTIISDVRKNDTNKIVAEAVFQKCDDSNANGHKFPKRVLMAAVNEVAGEVESRHLVGELDHPDDINDVNEYIVISVKDIKNMLSCSGEEYERILPIEENSNRLLHSALLPSIVFSLVHLYLLLL